MIFRIIVIILGLALCSCVTGRTEPASSPEEQARNDLMERKIEQVPPTVKRADTTYPAHTRKVLVTTQRLPDGVKYVIIKEIEVRSVWYGSVNKLNGDLADVARRRGADAVIQVIGGHKLHGFAWAAPYVKGLAVRFLNPETLDIKALPGQWQ